LPGRIGRYEIVRRLAVGGMAEVFLGRAKGEGGYEKLAAIKRILPHLAEDESFVGMFIDEARISARLSHGNIAQIFEFGQAGSSYFIAIEFVRGVDLRQILTHFRKREKVPPPAMVARIMSRVCAALDYAHDMCDEKGRHLEIIHRDASPSNVLVSFEGEVKLIDFGIAKAVHRGQETAVGTLKGKCSYMSPEQVTSRPMDRRSDIFAAGTVLFELLTGEHPFRATDELITLDRIRQADPIPPSKLVPSVPPELEAICLRALSLDPDQRFSTAGRMEQELDRFRRNNPLTRRKMATWVRRAFASLVEAPLIPPKRGKGELGRRLKSTMPSGSGMLDDDTEDMVTIARPEPTPPALVGVDQAPDPEAIQDLHTALKIGVDATEDAIANAIRRGPQVKDPFGPPDQGEPLADARRKKPGPGKGREGDKARRPFAMAVALSVILALGTIAAVGYKVYQGVQRGPIWLSAPDAAAGASAGTPPPDAGVDH